MLSPIAIEWELVANADETVGSAVPANTTWVIKEIIAKNSDVASCRLKMSVDATAATDSNCFLDHTLQATNTSGNFEIFPLNMVMTATQQLHAIAGTNDVIRVRVSGFAYT